MDGNALKHGVNGHIVRGQVQYSQVQKFLKGYRLIGIAGISLGFSSGVWYGLSQWGLVPLGWLSLGGLVWLLWLGVVSGGVLAWGEYRQHQRDRAQWHNQRRGYESLIEEQDANLTQLQHTEQAAAQDIMALQTECDRLTVEQQNLTQVNAQLVQERDRLLAKQQAAKLNCQNAEAVLEECDRLEHENSQLRHQVKSLKQENWQLREHPYCPQPDVDTNFDGQELEIHDSETNAIPVSRLTGISGKQAVRALEQLGFNVEHQNGSHIKLQRTHTQTCIVPNHPEVNPVTLKQVLRQAAVSLAAFLGAL